MRTSRLVFASATAALAFLALRPSPRADAALDLALAPLRLLGEIAAPLGLVRARSVSAAQDALDEREAGEVELRRELRQAERLAALPDDGALLAGRRFVHAEVLGRRPGHFDEIVIQPDGRSCAGLVRGMPVAHGDDFVGRLIEIDAPRPGQAVVELTTSKRFAVGATLAEPAAEGEAAKFVVGGLADTRPGAPIALSARAPSRREVVAGNVRVDEDASGLDPFAREASGFALGSLGRLANGDLALQPSLDFRGGLFDVVIVAPADVARPADVDEDEELRDGRWREVRAISCGEPSAAREGFKIAAGWLDGVREGAALVRGVHYVGSVVRAGALASDARTLGDRGATLPIVARVDGIEKPVALGRLVSLGRTDDGAGILLRWDAAVELAEAAPPGPPRRALLFTGAGEALVPRGLLVGETRLPSGLGRHELAVDPAVDVRDLRSLWLRVAEAEGESVP